MPRKIERRSIIVVSHPSGRPIERDRVRTSAFYRIPESGPLTPRLRRQMSPDCIGFVHHFDCDEPTE